jgi:hypothetical protein
MLDAGCRPGLSRGFCGLPRCEGQQVGFLCDHGLLIGPALIDNYSDQQKELDRGRDDCRELLEVE